MQRPETQPTEGADATPRLRPEQLVCAWCGEGIAVKARGRTPKWCSDSCRHRAWEQNRAAASGRAAVQVVERVVTVEKTVRVAQTPRGEQWAETLMTLVKALDTGRYYDKDLDVLGAAVIELNHAVERRLTRRRRGRFRT